MQVCPRLTPMRYLSSDDVTSAVAPRVAVDAICGVLKGGFDPASDPHRQKVALPHGEMHLLPSALDGAVGVKVLGIQSAGSEIGVPLVQGRICSWVGTRSRQRS